MDYQFREIRKGECGEVLAFAKANGGAPEPKKLHHHLSLMVKADGELVAAALCVEQEPTQFVIQIVHGDKVEDTLIAELTDRCLRKVQSENIASARLSSPDEQTIWQNANWLDQIQETPPADDTPPAEETATQAA